MKQIRSFLVGKMPPRLHQQTVKVISSCYAPRPGGGSIFYHERLTEFLENNKEVKSKRIMYENTYYTMFYVK